jgi:alpha-1,3/alpha-1,6-mannosyltransferase
MHVAFFHPDLGIGGAERLIVDCATTILASDNKNHVTIFTNYYDPRRCFEEARISPPSFSHLSSF